jgi:hypothetical protein
MIVSPVSRMYEAVFEYVVRAPVTPDDAYAQQKQALSKHSKGLFLLLYCHYLYSQLKFASMRRFLALPSLVLLLATGFE